MTGGGQDFVRVYSEATYGIPPEQVVGTIGELLDVVEHRPEELRIHRPAGVELIYDSSRPLDTGTTIAGISV